MADKEEKNSIDNIFDDKHLTGIGKKFDDYLKWEESVDLDKFTNNLADVWEKEFYQKASKKIEEVTGGLDKKLDLKKHEDKLKGGFADIMLGYLESAHNENILSKNDKVEFHELKERIKQKGVKGKDAYEMISQFYHNSHIGHHPDYHRKIDTIDKILDEALSQGMEGEKLRSKLRQSKDPHMSLAANKYMGHVWQEKVGKHVTDAEARMYLRKKVLPKYDAKIIDHAGFHEQNARGVHEMVKGFKVGGYDFKEQGIIDYKPSTKPEEKKK